MRSPGDRGHPVRSDRGFFPPKKNPVRSGARSGGGVKKTRSGPVPGRGGGKKTRSGPVPGGPPRSTGVTGPGPYRWAFWTSPSARMGVSDDDEWNSDSGEDDRDDQGNDDVQEIIHATSAAGGSAKSIFLLPERNEEDTGWLSHEGINPASAFNKMKPEDLPTVLKRKDMIPEEVAKNASLVDQ